MNYSSNPQHYRGYPENQHPSYHSPHEPSHYNASQHGISDPYMNNSFGGGLFRGGQNYESQPYVGAGPQYPNYGHTSFSGGSANPTQTQPQYYQGYPLIYGNYQQQQGGCGCGGHGQSSGRCGCGGHGQSSGGCGCGGHGQSHGGCNCGGHGISSGISASYTGRYPAYRPQQRKNDCGCGCEGDGGCRDFLMGRLTPNYPNKLRHSYITSGYGDEYKQMVLDPVSDSAPFQSQRRVTYQPFTRKYIDYREHINFIPVQRAEWKYEKVMKQIDFVPRQYYESDVEYLPRDKIEKRLRYLPIEQQIVHIPTDTVHRVDGEHGQKYIQEQRVLNEERQMSERRYLQQQQERHSQAQVQGESMRGRQMVRNNAHQSNSQIVVVEGQESRAFLNGSSRIEGDSYNGGSSQPIVRNAESNIEIVNSTRLSPVVERGHQESIVYRNEIMRENTGEDVRGQREDKEDRGEREFRQNRESRENRESIGDEIINPLVGILQNQNMQSNLGLNNNMNMDNMRVEESNTRNYANLRGGEEMNSGMPINDGMPMPLNNMNAHNGVPMNNLSYNMQIEESHQTRSINISSNQVQSSMQGRATNMGQVNQVGNMEGMDNMNMHRGMANMNSSNMAINNSNMNSNINSNIGNTMSNNLNMGNTNMKNSSNMQGDSYAFPESGGVMIGGNSGAFNNNAYGGNPGVYNSNSYGGNSGAFNSNVYGGSNQNNIQQSIFQNISASGNQSNSASGFQNIQAFGYQNNSQNGSGFASGYQNNSQNEGGSGFDNNHQVFNSFGPTGMTVNNGQNGRAQEQGQNQGKEQPQGQNLLMESLTGIMAANNSDNMQSNRNSMQGNFTQQDNTPPPFFPESQKRISDGYLRESSSLRQRESQLSSGRGGTHGNVNANGNHENESDLNNLRESQGSFVNKMSQLDVERESNY